MKTRTSRRPLAAVALATAVVLAAGTLGRVEAATARHGRQTAIHGAAPAAPAALAAVQHWVTRLLAAVGLAPAPPSTPAVPPASTTVPTVLDDNGAGIDPNG
jgi:hypothetical protein